MSVQVEQQVVITPMINFFSSFGPWYTPCEQYLIIF